MSFAALRDLAAAAHGTEGMTREELEGARDEYRRVSRTVRERGDSLVGSLWALEPDELVLATDVLEEDDLKSIVHKRITAAIQRTERY